MVQFAAASQTMKDANIALRVAAATSLLRKDIEKISAKNKKSAINDLRDMSKILGSGNPAISPPLKARMDPRIAVSHSPGKAAKALTQTPQFRERS